MKESNIPTQKLYPLRNGTGITYVLYRSLVNPVESLVALPKHLSALLKQGDKVRISFRYLQLLPLDYVRNQGECLESPL